MNEHFQAIQRLLLRMTGVVEMQHELLDLLEEVLPQDLDEDRRIIERSCDEVHRLVAQEKYLEAIGAFNKLLDGFGKFSRMAETVMTNHAKKGRP